jgi:hypothetical protein
MDSAVPSTDPFVMLKYAFLHLLGMLFPIHCALKLCENCLVKKIHLDNVSSPYSECEIHPMADPSMVLRIILLASS